MTAETVGQPRGAALALAARTRKPWQRRMESAGGRSPQGRATVTVKRQFLHTSNVVSRKLSPAVVMVFRRLADCCPFLWWLMLFCTKTTIQRMNNSGGQGRINQLGGPGAKIDRLEPMCFSKTKEVQKNNLENLVLYCVGVYSPNLEQPGHCCFTGRLFPAL